jgi:urease accessory protein
VPQRIASRLTVAAFAALLPTLASAHVGIGDAHGFAHGFGHPLGGVDHVLAMVAVGMFAAGLGGRALWAVPLAFVGFMAVGGALGMAGMAVPFVETGIALSIVALGLAVAARREWPVAAAAALAGLFAVFHGHAHGAEMPLGASAAGYALGFVAATALLHLAGIGVGLAGLRAPWRVTQLGGAAVALAGVAVLVGAV